MPKFTSIEAKESFSEKMEALANWHREVLADLIEKVIPTEQEDGLPWRRVARLAFEYYKEHKDEIRAGDSMFLTHKDSFISVRGILHCKSDLRDITARHKNPICTAANETGQIIGIYCTRKKAGIEESAAFHRQVINGNAERYNTRASLLNAIRYVQLPILTLAQLQAPEATD